MPIPLLQTSALVLVCDKNTSYQNPKSKAFLSELDLSKGQKMYDKVRHLRPHLDEIIPNRKFIIHNYIRETLKNQNSLVQVISLACGWDPILVKMSEEFPKHSFFGVDNTKVDLQEQLVKKITPHSLISYLNASIADPKQLVDRLTEKGWKKDQATCIVVEGISYYIPMKIFWNTLKSLTEHIQSDCFICGDFLVDWTQQKISKTSQVLGSTVFDMVKEACSQDYYPCTSQYVEKNLKEIAFNKIQFFTQDQIQKQRTGNNELWDKGDGHIQLFTAENTKN